SRRTASPGRRWVPCDPDRATSRSHAAAARAVRSAGRSAGRDPYLEPLLERAGCRCFPLLTYWRQAARHAASQVCELLELLGDEREDGLEDVVEPDLAGDLDVDLDD